MATNPYQTYQRISVSTADPTKIVIMLYEGAIKFMRQAIEHFEAGRRDDASERIKRALDIIHYLANTLDFEKGGEIAQNLSRLYDFARDTLAEANISGETEKIDAAIEILNSLLEGWQGIAPKSDAEVSAEVGQADPPDNPTSVSMMG